MPIRLVARLELLLPSQSLIQSALNEQPNLPMSEPNIFQSSPSSKWLSQAFIGGALVGVQKASRSAMARIKARDSNQKRWRLPKPKLWRGVPVNTRAQCRSATERIRVCDEQTEISRRAGA